MILIGVGIVWTSSTIVDKYNITNDYYINTILIAPFVLYLLILLQIAHTFNI